MALLINGITQKTPYSVPIILRKKYKYATFEQPMNIEVLKDGKRVVRSLDTRKIIETAWHLVQSRAAHERCNYYFKSLSRGKTLKEVLAEGNITLHCLVPKDGYRFEDLPLANTAERDIAIHPDLLLEDDHLSLTCTLIHELAHVAGAITDAFDPKAGEAEAALNYCQCHSKYNPQNLGQVIRSTSLRRA